MRLIVRTYEKDTLILEHIFYGKNKTFIENLVDAHKKYDEFFRSCLDDRIFFTDSGTIVKCKTTITWEL